MDRAISRNGTASGLELGKFEPLGRNSPAGRAAVPCVTGLSSSGSRSSEALRGLYTGLDGGGEAPALAGGRFSFSRSVFRSMPRTLAALLRLPPTWLSTLRM